MNRRTFLRQTAIAATGVAALPLVALFPASGENPIFRGGRVEIRALALERQRKYFREEWDKLLWKTLNGEQYL